MARCPTSVWRPIGGEGEPYPEWLRALTSASGAYAIRDKSSHNVLYVGSSGGKLYDTITRHFQRWGRKKQFWRGMRGAGHDPGMTYQRGRCEVYVCRMPKGEHLDLEADLIKSLRPRDNLVTRPDGGEDEAPF
jgi:excinuclease UvrABC nuclease subunit